MSPSFEVNNLLLQNLLESSILIDSKTAGESKEKSKGPNKYNRLNSLSPEFQCFQLKLSGDEP
jgi:hypothetical protein